MSNEKSAKAVRPFGIRDKIGYMFGDFGNDFTFILSSMFLMKFYTDIMGVEGWIAGVVMMVARVVDAFVVRPQNVWVFVAFYMVSYLGIAMFSMFCWALITDVIDYSELKNGVREDGTVYAVYSFARKLGQAASSGLTGGLLSLVGYTAATAYDPEVLEGVFNISTLVPAAGFLLLGLVLLLWYPLDKKTVEANVIALKKKHGEL